MFFFKVHTFNFEIFTLLLHDKSSLNVKYMNIKIAELFIWVFFHENRFFFRVDKIEHWFSIDLVELQKVMTHLSILKSRLIKAHILKLWRISRIRIFSGVNREKEREKSRFPTMRWMYSQINRNWRNAFVGAGEPIRLVFDLFAYGVEVGELLALAVQEFAVLGVLAVQELKNERSTRDNAGAARQEVSLKCNKWISHKIRIENKQT